VSNNSFIWLQTSLSSPDVPASQSTWARGSDDLQGVMGPSPPMALAPYIEGPKPTMPPLVTSRIPAASLTSGPGPGSGRTSWQDQRKGIDYSTLFRNGNHPAGPPSAVNPDARNPLQVTGLSNANDKASQRKQVSHGPACDADESLSPASLPSQGSAHSALLSERFRSADSGYSTGTKSNESITGAYPVSHAISANMLATNGTAPEPVPQRHPVRPHAAGTVYRQPRAAWSSGPVASCDSAHDQQQVCDFPDCSWVGKCPSDKR
jgi:hypothetical protein